MSSMGQTLASWYILFWYRSKKKKKEGTDQNFDMGQKNEVDQKNDLDQIRGVHLNTMIFTHNL